MNNANLNKENMNGLLNAVSKKIGISPEQLQKELESGKFDKALSSMNKTDAEKFQKAVNNPKLIEKMMSTPQAKALYKKLSGE